MTDSTARPALVGASWFTLLVAVLSMSVPYMEFATGARTIATMSEEYDAEGTTAAAVFSLPAWVASAAAVVALLALVIKELAMRDAAAKAAINLAVAVLMLVAGAWLAMIVRSSLLWLSDPLMIG